MSYEKNIYLVGFMGAGKSTVGRALADKTGKIFKDLDDIIEERENKKIVDIFEEKGEEYFRRLESEVIEEVSKSKNYVVATGGGAIVNPTNFQKLKESGVLISLAASPEAIYERVKDSKDRPLLNVENPIEEIKRMMFERAYYYIKSDHIIETTDRSIEEIVEEILELI
ncbi:shikimate kinase [Deferribacterales bacterium Es71-Z0220]|uniref:shikimate kinase n=1 Tax=Deferrivibrio essentukiensis TaxID=2880922 RepID=UPI001F603A38|nr:shikimate kinase [Deferrivibrio essentukiensis]MCB4203444.1 shikimate kinase [Deferrivibrio essentukiensis]